MSIKNFSKKLARVLVHQKIMDKIAHENWQMGVYLLWGMFEHKNGLVCMWGPSGSIVKVLTDVHEYFLSKKSWIMDYKNSWTISFENRQNRGLLALRSFQLKNGLFCHKEQTRSIIKVLTDVHEKFRQSQIWNSGS